jgi:hypothetical protein
MRGDDAGDLTLIVIPANAGIQLLHVVSDNLSPSLSRGGCGRGWW